MRPCNPKQPPDGDNCQVLVINVPMMSNSIAPKVGITTLNRDLVNIPLLPSNSVNKVSTIVRLLHAMLVTMIVPITHPKHREVGKGLPKPIQFILYHHRGRGQ